MDPAELWGLRPDHANPCRHIRHYSETRRRRLLSGDELARPAKHSNKASASVSRRSPRSARSARSFSRAHAAARSFNLRWEHVDRERWALRPPDSKTGGNEIPVGRAAQLVLKNIARSTSATIAPNFMGGSSALSGLS
jgi:hypothetical protein